MQKQDCFYLGRIVKKHSFKGEVVVKCDEDFADIFQELESVWIETKSHLIPFFIVSSRQTGTVFFRLKLEGVDTEQEAKSLITSDVFIPKANLPEYDDGDVLLKQELVGYQVKDKTVGNIGSVRFVNDSTAQILLEVLSNGKTIFIPLHDELVLEVNKADKTILFDLPEGLLDL